MSENLSDLERLRRELGERHPARDSHTPVVSLATVSDRGAAASAALEANARRNLYLLGGVGTVTAVTNPVLTGLFAQSGDHWSQLAVVVLAWPAAWLQPALAAMGAVAIWLAAISTSGFRQVTRVWARTAQAAAIGISVSAVGLALVLLGLLVLLAVGVALMALLVAGLFTLLLGS